MLEEEAHHGQDTSIEELQASESSLGSRAESQEPGAGDLHQLPVLPARTQPGHDAPMPVLEDLSARVLGPN